MRAEKNRLVRVAGFAVLRCPPPGQCCLAGNPTPVVRLPVTATPNIEPGEGGSDRPIIFCPHCTWPSSQLWGAGLHATRTVALYQLHGSHEG